MRAGLATFCLILTAFIGPRTVLGQALSAVRSAERGAADANVAEVERYARATKAAVSNVQVVSPTLLGGASQPRALDALLRRMDELATEALDARTFGRNREQNVQLIAEMKPQQHVKQMLGGPSLSPDQDSALQEAFKPMSAAPVFRAYSDVSFALGIRSVFARRVIQEYEAELETNVVGAVLGAGLGGITGEGLKKYVQDNLATSAILPVRSRIKVHPSIGIGLGYLDIGVVRMWPVLELSQADSSDSSIPREIVRSKTDIEAWSSPSISLAFPVWIKDRSVRDRSKRGVPELILTISGALPLYYPGDPFSALGALFTGSAKKYVRAGSSHVRIGVSIPFRVVKPAATPPS